MSSVYRSNRKIEDTDLIRLNSMGLSLRNIAGVLNCHHTTVTQRLQALGVTPYDTRRSFMDQVIKRISANQADWIADQLGPHFNITDFVTNLLVQEYIRSNQNKGKLK